MTVYAVYWPELNAFKVGSSTLQRQRWRTFTNRGAVLLGLKSLAPDISDYDFESVCHDVLRPVCRPAFNTADDARPYLGGSGGGYVECYCVPGDLMPSEILPFIDSQLEAFSAQA